MLTPTLCHTLAGLTLRSPRSDDGLPHVTDECVSFMLKG